MDRSRGFCVGLRSACCMACTTLWTSQGDHQDRAAGRRLADAGIGAGCRRCRPCIRDLGRRAALLGIGFRIPQPGRSAGGSCASISDSCCRMNHPSHRGSCRKPANGGNSIGKVSTRPVGKTCVAPRFRGCKDSTCPLALHRPGGRAAPDRPRWTSRRSRLTASRFCLASANGPIGTDGSTYPPSTVNCDSKRNRSRSQGESVSSRVAGCAVPHNRRDKSTTSSVPPR